MIHQKWTRINWRQPGNGIWWNTSARGTVFSESMGGYFVYKWDQGYCLINNWNLLELGIEVGINPTQTSYLCFENVKESSCSWTQTNAHFSHRKFISLFNSTNHIEIFGWLPIKSAKGFGDLLHQDGVSHQIVDENHRCAWLGRAFIIFIYLLILINMNKLLIEFSKFWAQGEKWNINFLIKRVITYNILKTIKRKYYNHIVYYQNIHHV